MLKDVELRKLPMSSLCNVAAILEINDDWKKLMSNIPRDPRSEKFEAKYTIEHIKQIEDHAKATNRKAADILFEEWGTSGRIRPTLNALKELLKKLEMFRAADEIALMLGEGPATRPLHGPAAPIDTGITAMLGQDTSEVNINGTTAQMRSDNYKTPKSLGNKTTLEMKSATDLIKFSTSESLNVPNFSALNIKTQDSVREENASMDYQTSLPNIDFNGSGLDTDILKDANLIHFEYDELQKITKNFSEKVIYMPDSGEGKLAGKIGSGGFGDVYVGYHPEHGHLAIKRERNILQTQNEKKLVMDIFNAEVRFLSRFRHKNIVPIIGICKDGPSMCLVCEYIGGGSLQQIIEDRMLTTESQRIDVMIGTAEGLKYLHDSKKPEDSLDIPLNSKTENSEDSKKNNFVHGDVKSANILLTSDFVPKLCDFGLGKQYESTAFVYPIAGTSAYMSPEALSGTITQKSDIYSYGIVILELLTGLKAIVHKNRSERINIKDFVEESCTSDDIDYVLDRFVANWRMGKEIYALATKCLVKDRKKRPTSEEICEILYKIKDDAELTN